LLSVSVVYGGMVYRTVDLFLSPVYFVFNNIYEKKKKE